MGRIQIYFLTGFLFCWGVQGSAESMPISCLPEVTSLQSFERILPNSILKKSYRLKTQKFDQIRETIVFADVLFNPKGDGKLRIRLRFEDPNVISLPFNLYGLMVSRESKPPIWVDFTESCTQPGVGFFPGQEFEIDPISLELDKEETLHLMIWGRI